MAGMLNPIDVHVGAAVRRSREARRVTGSQLADALGVTSRQVEIYESGAGRLSASKLFEIAVILKQPPSAFYEGLAVAGEESPFAAKASADLAARVAGLSPGRRRLVDILVRSLA